MNDQTVKPEDKKRPEEKELKVSELEKVTGGTAPLQIEGMKDIKGSSTDDKHKDWSE